MSLALSAALLMPCFASSAALSTPFLALFAALSTLSFMLLLSLFMHFGVATPRPTSTYISRELAAPIAVRERAGRARPGGACAGGAGRRAGRRGGGGAARAARAR